MLETLKAERAADQARGATARRLAAEVMRSEAARLRECGWSMREIAEEIGVSKTTAIRWIQEAQPSGPFTT